MKTSAEWLIPTPVEVIPGRRVPWGRKSRLHDRTLKLINDPWTSRLQRPRRTMNLDNEQKLAALLRDALRGVNVTHSRFGTINPNHYRQMLSGYRSTYEPNQRMYANLFDIQIQDASTAEAILDLLRDELKEFLLNDKDFFRRLSASVVIVPGADEEPPVEIIRRNLVRAAILDGPDNAARSFFSSIARGNFLFHNCWLLTGIKVEKELPVLDGISLIPLPTTTADLPGYLPDVHDVVPQQFVSKTVLKIDRSVPLTRHEPADRYAFAFGPEQRFRTTVHGAESKDFHPQRFFQALTLVGEQPVKDAIMWRHHSDDAIFDFRRATGFTFMSPSSLGMTASTSFSEDQIRRATDLYHKIVGLPQDVLNHLQIPIDRWTRSMMPDGNVDNMIDLGIAMEAFFLSGIREELTFRFRLRGSLYLGQTIEQRRLLVREFREIYGCRSSAVHEGTLPDDVTVNGQNVPIGQFIKRSQNLFKRCLLKVIESGVRPDWTAIELGGGQGAEN